MDVGIRYGHAEEIGSRRVMEDRTTVIRDLFSPDSPLSTKTSGSSVTRLSAAADGDDNSDKGFDPLTATSPSAASPATPSGSASTLFFHAPPALSRVSAAPGAGPASDAIPTSVLPHDSPKGTRSSGADRQEQLGRCDDVAKDGRPSSGSAEERGGSRSSFVSFFGVYDGHGGDVVAESLRRGLHKLVAKQVCIYRKVLAAVCLACFAYLIDRCTSTELL